MNNLATIIELVSVFVIAISIGGIYYFIGRSIIRLRAWRDDLKLEQEKQQSEHSPTGENSPRSGRTSV